MIDYFLYINVRILSFFICFLPIEFSLFTARIWGTILYCLLPKRARTCYLNLKLAFGDGLSSRERKKITRGVFKNLAMNFTELLYFPKIDLSYIQKHVKIVGREKVDEILSRKKGLVFFTAHFGNWEFSSLVGEFMGCSMEVLARDQKFKRLNALLNTYRQRLGSKVVSRGRMMRDLLSSLRDNASIGILGDQKAGTTGILVDFFSRPAFTPTGAFTLSLHTGAGILPVFMVRERGSFHRLEIKDELIVDKDNQHGTLKEFNRILEEYIRGHPSLWLWLHRRWKGSPSKNILILSDGKSGHTNQAKAVAKIIGRLMEERARGFRGKVEGELIKIKEVEVRFRNKFTKRLMSVLGLCSGFCCNGCLGCLRLCLDNKNFKELSSFYADIVISCGSSLAPLNIMLARENRARSIFIMKPGLISPAKFDLTIIPAHDCPKPGKNIVVTKAALNLIDDDSMWEGAVNLQSRVRSLEQKKTRIGVLIGGESKNYTLTCEIIAVVIDELIKAASVLSGELLVTTSRRTSSAVDALIKEKISGHNLCPVLVIANEKNIEGTVAGILGLSDIVVVSGESISMISEALSSNKPVIVFETGKKSAGVTKHGQFLSGLKEKKYVGLIKPEDLSGEVNRIYRAPRTPKLTDDIKVISEAISRLII
ncbi:MAG: ELM1/GtrOC1 family putative glycosyltransferase [Candidatus Omnitrophica bacterium]|nr:ELM1/GtrOC1 family putative glycosyltransferase [Candidatus Omnitrophota bacterium]